MAPDFIIYGVFLSLEIAYSNAGLYINREMSTQRNVSKENRYCMSITIHAINLFRISALYSTLAVHQCIQSFDQF